MSEIVVGLDLSPSARAALQWAAEQARATGQTLRAVHVTHVGVRVRHGARDGRYGYVNGA